MWRPFCKNSGGSLFYNKMKIIRIPERKTDKITYKKISGSPVEEGGLR